MLNSLKTVAGYGETEIIIEKSRFISYVKPIQSEEEAISFIEQFKKKHWDANHNCSAYVLGEQDHIQKASDDGEPSGTAGKPMLEVLKKQELKNVVVVVARYFGGIKLGAGGLIRAYTQATVEGIKAAQPIQKELHQHIAVQVDYTFLGKLENEIRKKSKWILDKIDYLDNITFHVLVPTNHIETFQEEMVNLTANQCQLDLVEERYVDRII